jgi:hypothetical protein
MNARTVRRYAFQVTQVRAPRHHAGKLSHGTFAVTFFLAVLAVLEMEGVRLADL